MTRNYKSYAKTCGRSRRYGNHNRYGGPAAVRYEEFGGAVLAVGVGAALAAVVFNSVVPVVAAVIGLCFLFGFCSS